MNLPKVSSVLEWPLVSEPDLPLLMPILSRYAAEISTITILTNPTKAPHPPKPSYRVNVMFEGKGLRFLELVNEINELVGQAVEPEPEKIVVRNPYSGARRLESFDELVQFKLYMYRDVPGRGSGLLREGDTVMFIDMDRGDWHVGVGAVVVLLHRYDGSPFTTAGPIAVMYDNLETLT